MVVVPVAVVLRKDGSTGLSVPVLEYIPLTPRPQAAHSGGCRWNA